MPQTGRVEASPTLVMERLSSGATNENLNFRAPGREVVSILSTSTQTLPTGATRWRWEVTLTVPFFSGSVGDTLFETFEFFDQDTTATLYGHSNPTSVRADTVYYSLLMDRSTWNLSSLANGIRLSNWFVTYDSIPASSFTETSTTSQYLHSATGGAVSFAMSEPKQVSVDGLPSPTSRTKNINNTPNLFYILVQDFDVPNQNFTVTYELKVTPGVPAQTPSPSAKLGLAGYKKSAIAVGVVLGAPALFAIIAVATYLFCLGSWLPIWAVLSRPGRAVIRRVKLWHRPPAPVFQDYGDEDEEELEDGLQMERVDADELLKFTGAAVGGAASLKQAQRTSHENVLGRLKKAMGRRLSNFVGWDGPPPPGSEKDKPPSKKDKKHKKQKSGGGNTSGIDTPMTASVSDLPHLVDLEGSTSANVMSQLFSRGSVQHEEASVGLLTDRDESPSPIASRRAAHASSSSFGGVESRDSSPGPRGDSRRDPGSGDEADDSLLGSRSSATPSKVRPEAGEASVTPPRAKKGLKHFKITSSMTSSTTDLLALPLASPGQSSQDNDTSRTDGE